MPIEQHFLRQLIRVQEDEKPGLVFDLPFYIWRVATGGPDACGTPVSPDVVDPIALYVTSAVASSAPGGVMHWALHGDPTGVTFPGNPSAISAGFGAHVVAGGNFNDPARYGDPTFNPSGDDLSVTGTPITPVNILFDQDLTYGVDFLSAPLTGTQCVVASIGGVVQNVLSASYGPGTVSVGGGSISFAGLTAEFDGVTYVATAAHYSQVSGFFGVSSTFSVLFLPE